MLTVIDIHENGDPALYIEQTKRPALVMFYAPWCSFCTHFLPIVTEVIEATDGQWAVIRINADENLALAEAYQIGMVPSLFWLQPGYPPEPLLGISDKPELVTAIQEHLALYQSP